MAEKLPSSGKPLSKFSWYLASRSSAWSSWSRYWDTWETRSSCRAWSPPGQLHPLLPATGPPPQRLLQMAMFRRDLQWDSVLKEDKTTVMHSWSCSGCSMRVPRVIHVHSRACQPAPALKDLLLPDSAKACIFPLTLGPLGIFCDMKVKPVFFPSAS